MTSTLDGGNFGHFRTAASASFDLSQTSLSTEQSRCAAQAEVIGCLPEVGAANRPCGGFQQIEIGIDVAQRQARPYAPVCISDHSRGCNMSKAPANQEHEAVPAQTAPQDGNKQAAEQRRYEDVLEDDEVFEALKSLHASKQH
jgi:hypothetical protein